MKLYFLLLCLFVSTFSLIAQSTTYNIKGIVEDTLQNPLIFSTVLLLEKSDSTMVDFTRTEMDGSFKFKDVLIGDHIVKTTYIGYIPLTVNATSTDGQDIDLKVMKMTEIAQELMEVVIKAAKAPMKMRGDTLEYDATTFKVPEGSTVEDLLRRLPGMEVDQDGTITSDGKSVNRVTVDGKTFFGNNPQAATKNLPAEGVSKVQVFDTKSEEEEITGATSQSQDKTMNLELKEEFKSGGFGRVVAGIGTEERAELKGNYNKFNNKIQFSIVGVGNNTGRNGLSWNDYQDFMGSQSFDFGGQTDYGFGGGGHRYYFGGGSGGLESSIQSIFFRGSQSGGYPENYNGGLNFNYDHNKLKVSSVYYYNQAGLDKNSLYNADSFYPDFVQKEDRENTNNNVSKGHRMEVQVEKEIDSLHTIIFKVTGAKINEDDLNIGLINQFRNDIPRSEGDFENNTNTSGYLGNAMVLLRKKFKKKGRKMGLNASFLRTELKDNWTQNSETKFLEDGEIISREKINQANDNIADKNHFKANALYVEPLSKRIFFQTFYNYSNRSETGERNVIDVEETESVKNTFLSREYENKIQLNRAGSSIRYSHNGTNISIGAAYQHFDLYGLYSRENDTKGTVDQTFTNWIPHISLNLTPVRNSYIDIDYTRLATEPNIEDLRPIIDNSNPYYITEGNPDLLPEVKHNFSTYISRSYPASGIRMSLRGDYNIFSNKISTDQRVDENLITFAKPLNINGGQDGSVWLSFNFPIIKNRVTVSLSNSIRYDKIPALVNDIENITRSTSYNPRVKVNITPSDDLAIYINGGYSTSSTSYDINTSQDQNYKNYNVGIELNSKLVAGFFLNSSYKYNRYVNDRFNQDRAIPILNASIYRQFMPNNQAELRLSVYDGLDRNESFSQRAYGNRITENLTESLGRYYMVSFTYNIKGLKTGVRKNGWW